MRFIAAKWDASQRATETVAASGTPAGWSDLGPVSRAAGRSALTGSDGRIKAPRHEKTLSKIVRLERNPQSGLIDHP